LIKPIQSLVGEKLKIKDDIRELESVSNDNECVYTMIETMKFELEQIDEAIEVLEDHMETTIK